MGIRVGIAVCLLSLGVSAQAAEVPFGDEHIVSTAALRARRVFAADLDRDGDLDLLSASWADDKIAWYENTDGAGTFGPQQVISTAGDRTQAVHGADIDGDGDVDVLSISSNDNTIAWYENADGLGSFGPEQIISLLANGPISVFAADLDGDADIDVLSASIVDDKIAWYENTDGLGTFAIQQVISLAANSPRVVRAADVDGDGDQDVLSASSNDYKIAWYENTDGAGTFGAQQVISTAAFTPYSLFTADVDGDADIDVLSASVIDDEIAWYENTDGSGSFGAQQVISTAGDGAAWVVATDLDGDGDTDVLAASAIDDEIAWYENADGAGSFEAQRVITTAALEPTSVLAADVDGDGDPDVVSASDDDHKIAWHENRTIHRSALFPEPSPISDAGWWSFFVADVDTDGDLDIFTVNPSGSDGAISWYQNTDGAGTFGARQVIDTKYQPRSAFGADLDRDGDVDVLVGSVGFTTSAWYENTDGAGTFGPELPLSSDPNACSSFSVFASDLDTDGDLDALAGQYCGPGVGQIVWYENTDGAGSFGAEQLLSTSIEGPWLVRAADLDGDGDQDVLSDSRPFSPGIPKIVWYENTDGSGTFGWEQVIATGVWAGEVSDVDGDGDVDVLSAAFLPGSYGVVWHENDDTWGFVGTQHVISTPASYVSAVWAADLDRDGDTDAMSSTWGLTGGRKAVAWHENTDGAGTFGEEQVIHSADILPRGMVLAADLDGDGNQDVLSVYTGDEPVAWHRNHGGQFALATTDSSPAVVLEGDSSDVLEIVHSHRGRSGDTDEELATVDLLLEEAPGDPLTSAEANAVIDALAIYRDTGSGLFEIGSDTLVASVGTLSLTAGVQTVTLPDGHAGAQVAHGTPAIFFAVVTLTGSANAQTPHQFRMVHLTESSSTAEDRGADIGLSLEYVPDASSGIVLAASTSSDEDGDRLLDTVETGTGIYVSETDTGTDPLDPDSDNDSFNDGWEVDAGSNPNDPNDVPSTEIPALGPWGLLLLSILAGCIGLRSWRRGS